MIEVINRARLSGQTVSLFESVLAPFAEIDHVARFAETQVPPLAFSGSVAYDDHTHDIVVSRHSDSIVLVFESTCSGRLRRVTIWDRQPTAANLLVARRERGAPAEERNGAACRFGGHIATVERRVPATS